MNRSIFLDTGPLGILTNPRRPAATVEMLRWAADHLRAGNRLLVPAIADFEVRRELMRMDRVSGIAALDTWNGLPHDRYVVLTDTALRLAAHLWAQARKEGTPTADPKALDGYVLIAAQALDFQRIHDLDPADVVVATVNVGHLSRFVAAEHWVGISP